MPRMFIVFALLSVGLVGCGDPAFTPQEWKGMTSASERLGAFITNHDVEEFINNCDRQGLQRESVQNEARQQGCWDRYRLLLGERTRIVRGYIDRGLANADDPCEDALLAYRRALQPIDVVVQNDGLSQSLPILDEARDQLDPYIGPPTKLTENAERQGKDNDLLRNGLQNCNPLSPEGK